MAMTSYEVVRRALEFQTPDRIPLRFDEFELDDTMMVAPNQIFPWENQDKRNNLDEWGCLWARSEFDNMGQVKGHPLAEWSALEHYLWPDPDDPAFYFSMDRKFTDSENKYVLTGVWFTLFERMHMVHGFENTLKDLLLEREKIEMLADRILEYDMRVIENIANQFRNSIHGIYFSDDWGTEQGPIISPKLWSEFFKPRYKRLFDQVHEIGWHVWLHSCGKVNAFLEDFIELGLNAINLEQPRTLGIEDIGAKFSGRLCFAGPCDIQNTLPLKDEQGIYEEAELLINCWGTPEGGFIAQDKGGGEAYGATIEKRRAMLHAFQKYDRWKKVI
jgi:uroporphyrinogen decarboxylase